MQSNFVRDVPTIEIEDGLVHVSTAQGDWWWKPSTFRRYVELGRRQLDLYEVTQHEPPVLRFRK